MGGNGMRFQSTKNELLKVKGGTCSHTFTHPKTNKLQQQRWNTLDLGQLTTEEIYPDEELKKVYYQDLSLFDMGVRYDENLNQYLITCCNDVVHGDKLCDLFNQMTVGNDYKFQHSENKADHIILWLNENDMVEYSYEY